MMRNRTGQTSGALASPDPFSGPAVRDELEPVDLMREPSPHGQALGLEPAAAGVADPSFPRWDLLVPRGLYAELVRPFLTYALLLVALPVALAVLAPLVLANWLSFRDLRLVFFHQERVGRHGRVFRIHKLRTMRPLEDSGSFEAWSDGDRNRVTALGRFLRSTHLDEVPQIWNIVRGDMDFIGPRPEMVEVHEWACREVPGFERRLALRPGITGLAQITQGYAGRCPRAYRRKLSADERYRRTLSFAGDLSILARTVAWMLRGRGWGWRSQGG